MLLLYYPSIFALEGVTPPDDVISPGSRLVALTQGNAGVTRSSWTETLDPSDYLDYSIDCSALLATNETIVSFTLVPTIESALLGLTLTYPSMRNNIAQGWLSVLEADRTNTSYNAAGVSLPVELTITTSSGRIWQRTALVKVAQR